MDDIYRVEFKRCPQTLTKRVSDFTLIPRKSWQKFWSFKMTEANLAARVGLTWLNLLSYLDKVGKNQIVIVPFKAKILFYIWCNIPVIESFILDILTIGQQQKYTADCIVLFRVLWKAVLCALGSVLYAGKWMAFCVTAAKFEARLFYSCSPFFFISIGYCLGTAKRAVGSHIWKVLKSNL